MVSTCRAIEDVNSMAFLPISHLQIKSTVMIGEGHFAFDKDPARIKSSGICSDANNLSQPTKAFD